MFKISKEMVNNFAEVINLKAYKNSYAIIDGCVKKAMDNIISRNSNIRHYELFVANEVFSGTEFAGSSLDLFLYLDAKQLELNYDANNTKTKNIKNNIVMFFKEFINGFKIIRKRKKKLSEKKILKEEKKLSEKNDYDLKSFLIDLQLQFCKLFSKTTSIIVMSNKIKIVGKEDLGIDVNIYPVFKNDDNAFYLYNLSEKNKTIIDFRDKQINVSLRNNQTNSLFKIQTRIFNGIYWNIFKTTPNQIFIESLLYNVPIDFFTCNIYESTITIINYLKNAEIYNMVSICDDSIKIFDELLNTESIESAYKFIKLITI